VIEVVVTIGVINVCNSLSQDTVDFTTSDKFKSSLSLCDLPEFSKCD